MQRIQRSNQDARAAERVLRAADGAMLDRLTELAASLLGTAASQLSLLSDEQTVAAAAGLPPGARGSRSPLEDSLCTVTAELGSTLAVPDAPADERVAGLPPVVSGAVGSYLGVPLVIDEATVGALCVFDPQRRAWSRDDAATLERLAHWAMAELQLTAAAAELNLERARVQLAVEAAGIGSFDLDLGDESLRCDARTMELFELDADRGEAALEELMDRIHPEDRLRVRRAIAEAVEADGSYTSEHRLALPSGQQRWIRARGRVLDDAEGRSARLLGSVEDATEEKDAEARAARVLESMAVGFLSMSKDWRITYVNAEAETVLGSPRAELLDRDFWQAFPLTVGTEFETTSRRAVATGVPQSFEAYYGEPLDAWLEIRALPSPDGLSLSFVDVTSRHRAQELLDLSHEVSERLSLSLDVDTALRELAAAVVPRLGDWSVVWSGTVDGRPGGAAATSHADPRKRRLAAECLAAWTRAGSLDALQTREALRLDERAVRERLAALDGTAIGGLAPTSALAVPLVPGEKHGGVLVLFREEPRPAMSDDESAAARAIALRAGAVLQNARLYEEQRETARRLDRANGRLRELAAHERSVAQALQEAMLTQLPQPAHLQLSARYLTASGTEQVGGDWYDAIVLPSGATLVTIGDVIGHDIRAAASMGQLRNMLRMVATDRDEPPAEIVARLDRAMRSMDIATLATLISLRIEQPAGEHTEGVRVLRWTSAGHPAPILVAPDGRARLLDQAPDILLGVEPDTRRRDHTVTASPDSTLLLYTDGLIETRTSTIDAGQARLLSAVERHRELTMDELLIAISDDMVGADPDDDVALLAVRFE